MDASYSEISSLYRDALLLDVIPFWEKHSLDWEKGGYWTCLDREGRVYDTDKFMWLQARQVWTFSMLYNRWEKRDNWLAIARHGADFILAHGMDDDGNWYFALDGDGRPLVQPYNIFSDCFAAMALSQYTLASGDGRAQEVALKTFHNIIRRKDNPKGKYSKAFPGTRPMRTLAIPMILANLCVEMEWLLPPHVRQEVVQRSVAEVMSAFLDHEQGVLYENVSPEGKHVDCFEGRLLNPGHGIEAMWFVMDIAHRSGDSQLVNRAVEVMLTTLDLAWDREYGGLFYFLDAQGHPPQQLEWDQKLWWVHLESLVALAMGLAMTGRRECWEWYRKVHEYAWSRFPDPAYGEWYGYLNRRGEVLLSLKGGKWKGCFHVPRALFLCHRHFDSISRRGEPVQGEEEEHAG